LIDHLSDVFYLVTGAVSGNRWWSNPSEVFRDNTCIRFDL